MTSTTHAAYGDPTNQIKQAVGLFTTHMQRNGSMAKLTGKMPKGEAGASETLRKQTTQHMPIVTAMDLGRGDGDEIEFNLLNPVNAKPIMGSAYAEGRGTNMSITKDTLRVNQARFPVNLGDAMTGIRSPVDFRKMGRPVAQSLMDRYVDQTLMVHMAGARGFHYNTEWVVPTTADADFPSIMVNRVKAPTKNRHYIADADTIKPFTVSGGEIDLATTDVLDIDVVDAIRTTLDQIALPPPIVKFEGDEMADDEPIRVLLVSPAQYNAFAKDPTFRNYQTDALKRASMPGQHNIFRGSIGMWNNILIVKQNRPVRFYAGQEIKYCASHTSETETGVIVPASFSTTHAVDRAVLLGGQAIAQAFAAHNKSGIPFFWSEKELDHGDKVELLIGAIRGVSKIRFEVDTGDGKEFTDYGCIAIDTAVPLTSAN